MFKLGSFVTLVLLAGAIGLPARAAPVLEYGVSAFISIDAGGSHWHVNVYESNTVTSTGVFSQGVADSAGGGAQGALTSAYASVGALGGKVLAVASGYPLGAGQGSNDLNWYTDLLVTGTPGTRVAFVFATSIDGFSVGGGTGFSGGVHATTWVGGVPLADWDFSMLSNPGPFNELAFASYEFDVGSVVRLTSLMTVVARAEGLLPTSTTAESNGFDTSAFYVDVVTPGGGYLTGGGVVFPRLPGAAVPEPSPAGLLAVALALLGWSRSGPWRRALRRAAALLCAAVAVPAAMSAPAYTYVTLDVPGAVQTQAYGIDDAGRVVGAWLDGAGTWRGFRYAAGAYTTIEAPGAAYTDAFGITNSGAIVGTASPVARPGIHDFTQGYLLAGGSFTPITVPGAVQTGAYGVNDAATVVGSYRSDPSAGAGFGHHGFVWSAGVFTTIDIPNAAGGLDDTAAIGINNAGQIVGEYGLFCDVCASRSFLWDAGAVTTFAPFGAVASAASDINDTGDIVGWWGSGGVEGGYLYADGEFSLIAPPSASFAEAFGINNQRWVVGAWADAAGVTHGFLATPQAVPEPDAGWLAILALLAAGRLRRVPTRRVTC